MNGKLPAANGLVERLSRGKAEIVGRLQRGEPFDGRQRTVAIAVWDGRWLVRLGRLGKRCPTEVAPTIATPAFDDRAAVAVVETVVLCGSGPRCMTHVHTYSI